MVGCQALQENKIRIKSVNIFGDLCPTCQSQLSDSGLIAHVLVHGLFVEQNRSYIFCNFIGRGICTTSLEDISWITDQRKAGKLCLFQKSQQNINTFSSIINLKVTKLSLRSKSRINSLLFSTTLFNVRCNLASSISHSEVCRSGALWKTWQ